jgi:hypothetical protein
MKPGDKVILKNVMCWNMTNPLADATPIAFATVTIMRIITIPGRNDIVFMSPFSRHILRTAASNAEPYEHREKPATHPQQNSAAYSPVRTA